MAVIAVKCPHINITVIDANPDKIKAWNGPLDNLPVYEPGLSDVVGKARGSNLFFSDNIAWAIEKAEMIFVAVNTPTKTEGAGAGMAADLRYIEACSRDIAKYSKSNKIVIEKSTLPVRTAEKIKEILEENSTDIHFEILSNPEFLAEGTAIQDLFKSDRVLIGGDESESGQNAVQALVDIYSNWIPKEKILILMFGLLSLLNWLQMQCSHSEFLQLTVFLRFVKKQELIFMNFQKPLEWIIELDHIF